MSYCIRKYNGKDLHEVVTTWDKAQALHGNLEVEVFKRNQVGCRFYHQYGFRLIEEKIHEQTGEEVLRLKFTADKPL